MSGVELREGVLVVDRAPNELDELAIAFSAILDDLDIRHVFVSGYVAVLAGRSRATEDIDVILEHPGDDALDALVERLEAAGMWGPAVPLATIHDLEHEHIWIAREGESVPRLEVKFVDGRYDRASLENHITARLTTVDESLPIGPMELQIAYKLWMTADRDFEDALYLYSLFGETLSTEALERWVEELDVTEAYERLRSA